MARPTIKTPELIEQICLLVAQGRSIKSIGEEEGMPDAKSIWTWLNRDEEFLLIYTRAIQARAIIHAERIDELAEMATRGEIPADVARVAIDAKKWTASRLLPKIYGDRTQVEATVTHTHTLHLEALKALAGKGSGYIEGQATEIPAVPTFGGERLGGSDRALEGAEAVGQAVDRPDPPGTPDRPGAPACAPPALSTRPLRRGLRLREPPSPPVVGDGVVARKKRKGKGE
jgi:hypothetical protein